MPTPPVILAIESSCDDTGVAVIRGREVLANAIANQAVHEQYGGVVPELASRAHAQNIVPTLESALQTAGIEVNELDAVAYTRGPGLMGSLHVGTAFAKSWAWAHGLPMVPVNHMQAHILAHFLAPDPSPDFPFLCLTVSGGHTQLVRVDAPLAMTILGETKDDAAGEAFDKVAKLMGLPYPGGPVLDRMAAEGDGSAFAFTKPNVPGLDMSFSGLKTQIWQFLQQHVQRDPAFIEARKNDIAASVQCAILDILMDKVEAAVEQTGILRVAIAGGVSANRGLRARLRAKEEASGWEVFIPPMAYCTDNAAMIAMAASLMFEAGARGRLDDEPVPRWAF
jgi:N6-L-threonylcarbamoyladenine synthase